MFLLMSADPQDYITESSKRTGSHFDNLPSLREIFAAAASGFQSGKNWKDNYIPGGPYISNVGDRLSSKAWFEGFYQGLKENEFQPKVVKNKIIYPLI